ncbi:hypothetical protein LXL04_000090 [Taraxacum kok-saghyz]
MHSLKLLIRFTEDGGDSEDGDVFDGDGNGREMRAEELSGDGTSAFVYLFIKRLFNVFFLENLSVELKFKIGCSMEIIKNSRYSRLGYFQIQNSFLPPSSSHFNTHTHSILSQLKFLLFSSRMSKVQSPVTENILFRPKTGRQPLKPIRSPSNVHPPPLGNSFQKPNLKPVWIEISEDSNKENPNQNEKRNIPSNLDPNPSSVCAIAAAPVQIQEFEVSLAEELSAIREKMERLRSDREKTEKMLRDRELMMDMKMKELDQRGEIQKVLEIEVDRLYRLNELRSVCNRILPIKSLREKENEKIKPDKSQGEKAETTKAEKGGNVEETEEEKVTSPCGVMESK